LGGEGMTQKSDTKKGFEKMDRLEQIKKSVDYAVSETRLFGQLLLDVQWLIEKAERVAQLEEEIKGLKEEIEDLYETW
jgi:uncharacterized protein (UPF0335 family)